MSMSAELRAALDKIGPVPKVPAWHDDEADYAYEYEVNERIKAQRDALLVALREMRLSHYVCDDCWYSCPMSGECCDDRKGNRTCNCGAESHNKLIDELLAKCGGAPPAAAPELSECVWTRSGTYESGGENLDTSCHWWGASDWFNPGTCPNCHKPVRFPK